MELNEKDIVVMSGGVEVANEPAPKKKKHRKRHLLNIVLVLLIAALVIFFSLKDDFNAVITSIASANVSYLVIAFAMAIIIFIIDGLILYILARLYTTRFKIGQGLANALIGVFYNDVTPSSSGGQFMQAYTFKKQGLELSSAASILVMHFLIYQTVLVLYGIVALIAKLPLFLGLNPVADFGTFELTLIPLSIVGFAINFTVIATIILLSYSKWMHTFVINSVVAIGTKMKLIKHPDATKQNWQSQIENFRIELRRLQSNIPVTLLLGILFFIKLTIFYSIPYVIGLALKAPMTATYYDTVFLSAYLQMMTNMVPLPGASGFSEYFFTQVFVAIYGSGAVTTAAQLIWRSATFYLGLIVGGFVTAFYRSSPKEIVPAKSDRKTFIELQKSTYEMRKKTSDTMFQTSQLSRKDIEQKMKKVRKDLFGVQRRKAKRTAKKVKLQPGFPVSESEEVVPTPLDTSETHKGEE